MTDKENCMEFSMQLEMFRHLEEVTSQTDTEIGRAAGECGGGRKTHLFNACRQSILDSHARVIIIDAR